MKKTKAPTKTKALAAPRRKATITSNGISLSTRIELAPDDATRDTNLETVQIFLDQALKRFQLAAQAESYNRTEGLIDVLMVDGEGQWDPDVKALRVRKKRPCLTINRFIPMVAHVANEQREARPAIQVDPIGGGADPESAEIRQGLIRHIEIDSTAETVYDTAFEAMLEKGWSWFRIVSEYESDESFNQVLKIQGFENDFCVYIDPTATEPTRKDMKWAFIVEDMPIGQYLTTYPESKIASLSSFSSIGDGSADWLTTQYVRVAEYFYSSDEEAMLVQLEDGTGYWKDELQEVNGFFVNKELFEQMQAGDIQPEQVPLIPVYRDADGEIVERKSKRTKVKWCKINAREILEGNLEKTAGRDWKGKYIPLIMVAGRQRNIRGQRRLAGMVRNNRDAQRMYNYWVTAFTEMVALAPKSPFLAAAGQIEKYKHIWDTANEEAWPYLPYDPKSLDNTLVPPPSRQSFEPPVQAMIGAIRQADNDLKAGFNIYDAALGQKGPQESGRAILARKVESDSGNVNWLDNMKRSIQHCGDVLLDLIPSRYDAARVITIVRAEGEREAVQINQEFMDAKTKEPKHYDLTSGKYSCTVSVGPAHATKRQEAVEAMLQLVSADPKLFSIIGDLIVENMDWPGAAAIVKRLKKMLPANLQENDDETPIPPAMQAKYQALMEQHEQLSQALEQANETIRTKKLDIASKEFITGLQEQTKLVVAEMKVSSEEARTLLKAEVERIQNKINVMHDRLMNPPVDPAADGNSDAAATPAAAAIAQ